MTYGTIHALNVVKTKNCAIFCGFHFFLDYQMILKQICKIRKLNQWYKKEEDDDDEEEEITKRKKKKKMKEEKNER